MAGYGQVHGVGAEPDPGADRATVVVAEHGLAVEGQAEGFGVVVLLHAGLELVRAGRHGREGGAQYVGIDRGVNHGRARGIGGAAAVRSC